MAALQQYGRLDEPVARAALCEDFLRRWLITSESPLVMDPRSASGSYFFLFWKNLSVTNVSIVELMALLRQFTKDRALDSEVQIDFIATEHYKEFLNNLWESLFVSGDAAATTASGSAQIAASERENAKADHMSPANITKAIEQQNEIIESIEKAIDQIIEFHENFFKRTIILDVYYCSAIIHIPLSLKIDVGEVTLQSGYVHSSGLALYFRNIEKAEQGKFVSRLSRFLSSNTQKRYFITPYAWEFFSPFERESAASIRNGLDGVRIHLKKHFFENDSLLNFIAQLKQYFPDQLSVPTGVKDYAEEREASLNDGASQDCTIWFVTDSGFTFDRTQGQTNKNKNIYIVAYAQYFLNCNQLNIFKERKPGWMASTTLPHTLSAAMINIARHQWELMRGERPTSKDGSKAGRGPVIVDPFCGTGTILIDALARFQDAVVLGFDQSPAMPTLVRNNLAFLATTKDEVLSMLSSLRTIEGAIQRALSENRPASIIKRAIDTKELPAQRIPERDFEYCLNLLLLEIKSASGDENAEISDAAILRLAQKGFSKELLARLDSNEFPIALKVYFYIQWRALRMNTFSMRTEARSPDVVLRIFLEELDHSIREFRALDQLLSRNVVEDKVPFRECVGSYSKEGVVNPAFFGSAISTPFVIENGRLTSEFIQRLNPGLAISRVEDSVSLLEQLPQVADVIVTDPPYGFNALESESDDMKALYARMIPSLVNALRPWGQLVMSLPAYAKNGKQVPFYQTRESVVKQIIATTESRGRSIVRYVETYPADRDFFQPPWYWGTASTIERRIVHFVIR